MVTLVDKDEVLLLVLVTKMLFIGVEEFDDVIVEVDEVEVEDVDECDGVFEVMTVVDAVLREFDSFDLL